MADIQNIIRQLAKSDGETGVIICTVDSVDKKARTIDCTPINEAAPLLGVNLQANQESGFGLCIFPEVGAFVAVGFVNDSTTGIMLVTDKIESAEIVIDKTAAVIDADGLRIDAEQMSAHFNKTDIIFNGGDLNGLIIIQKLTDKLNELKDTVNDFIIKYNSHIHVTTATVGASATPGVLTATQSTATPAKAFNKADYENTKIKQ